MVDYSKYTDNELTNLLKSDNPLAFTEVYERYWAKLYNAAYNRLGSTALCEEIVQDVFLKVWERRKSINIDKGLSNYLHTAVKYAVIDHYRKRLLESNFIDYSIASIGKENDVEEKVILNDLKRYLETSIAKLPPKCRSVYTLSRNEYKSNKEIASILQISEKTVEGHLTKALQLLRLNLSEYLLLACAIYLKKNF